MKAATKAGGNKGIGLLEHWRSPDAIQHSNDCTSCTYMAIWNPGSTYEKNFLPEEEVMPTKNHFLLTAITCIVERDFQLSWLLQE